MHTYFYTLQKYAQCKTMYHCLLQEILFGTSDLYYAPPLIGGGIKWCFCLTSVCHIHWA